MSASVRIVYGRRAYLANCFDASLPQLRNRIFLPPGCESAYRLALSSTENGGHTKVETSKTWALTTTQASFSALCLATSLRLYCIARRVFFLIRQTWSDDKTSRVARRDERGGRDGIRGRPQHTSARARNGDGQRKPPERLETLKGGLRLARDG